MGGDCEAVEDPGRMIRMMAPQTTRGLSIRAARLERQWLASSISEATQESHTPGLTAATALA